MKTWEVIIPPAGGGALRALTIQSATWMMALSEALRQLADPAQLSSLMCHITPHGSLEIVDSQGHRTITIREVGESGWSNPAEEAADPPAAAVPQAAAPETAPGPGRMTAPYQTVSAASVPAPGAPEASPALAPTAPVPSHASGADSAWASPGSAPPAASPGSAPPVTAAPPAQAAPRKRRTAEMVAQASTFNERKSPPVAAPPVAAPPTIAAVPEAKVPGGSVSAGEIAPKETYRKAITEPAIIIDQGLVAEIEELETLRRTRESAMAPPEVRPIPHQVFKVMAEAREEPRPEAVRRRFVSVWPNPPEDALREVLLLQLGQVQAELAATTVARRVIIAAFDHAFDKAPERPPLGLCTWSAEPGQEVAPACILGEEAARAWAPALPAEGSAAPEGAPATAAYLGPQIPSKDPSRTAIVSIPGRDSAPGVAPGHSWPPPEEAPQGAPASPSPSIADRPADLMITVFQAGPVSPPHAAPPPIATPAPVAAPLPIATPAPVSAAAPVAAPEPTAAPASAPAASYAPPPASPPRGLSAQTFERMQALFYMTDRENALAFSLDTALGLIPSQAGAILIYDPGPRELYLVAARGPGGANPDGFRVPVHEGLAGFCAMEGIPLALSHVDQDQRFHTPLAAHYGIAVHSIVGAPIQYEGRFYGVMELVNRQPEGQYLGEEVTALAYIARQLAERLATVLAP